MSKTTKYKHCADLIQSTNRFQAFHCHYRHESHKRIAHFGRPFNTNRLQVAWQPVAKARIAVTPWRDIDTPTACNVLRPVDVNGLVDHCPRKVCFSVCSGTLYPLKVPLPVLDPGPPFYVFLGEVGPTRSRLPQTTSRSAHPFSQGSRSWLEHRHTNHDTAVCCNSPHLPYACDAG